MRSVIRIFLAIVIVLLVTFAIANRQVVIVNLWPLPFTLSVPLFIAILGAFAVGLLVGVALIAISRQRQRMKAHSAERRAERAERLAAERERESTPPPAALPHRALPGRN